MDRNSGKLDFLSVNLFELIQVKYMQSLIFKAMLTLEFSFLKINTKGQTQNFNVSEINVVLDSGFPNLYTQKFLLRYLVKGIQFTVNTLGQGNK